MRNEVITVPLTWPMVFGRPGTLLQVSQVKVICDRPSVGMVAGFCTDEPRPRAAAIIYHAGRRGWFLEIESFSQRSNELVGGRLDSLMGRLEEMAGVSMSSLQIEDSLSGKYVLAPKRIEVHQ